MAKKKPANKKASTKSAKKKEESKNPEDYPLTPVVQEYRKMLSDAIDKLEQDIGDGSHKKSKKRIEYLKENYRLAPFTLRNSK